MENLSSRLTRALRDRVLKKKFQMMKRTDLQIIQKITFGHVSKPCCLGEQSKGLFEKTTSVAVATIAQKDIPEVAFHLNIKNQSVSISASKKSMRKEEQKVVPKALRATDGASLPRLTRGVLRRLPEEQRGWLSRGGWDVFGMMVLDGFLVISKGGLNCF